MNTKFLSGKTYLLCAIAFGRIIIWAQSPGPLFLGIVLVLACLAGSTAQTQPSHPASAAAKEQTAVEHAQDIAKLRAAYYLNSVMLDYASEDRLVAWAASHPDDGESLWAAAAVIRQSRNHYVAQVRNIPEMLKGAATRGYSPAWAELAIVKAAGIGLLKDESGSLADLQRGIAANEPMALFLMGQLRDSGRGGVEKDPAEATLCYRRALDGGMTRASLYLAGVYWKQHDQVKALEALRAGANGGDCDARCKLAECERSAGNAKEACRLAQLAAASELPAAMRLLADYYHDGVGVAPDAATAGILYRRAADEGDLEAQARLGVAYCRGDGVFEDRQRGIAMLEVADQKGCAEAAFSLGLHYMKPGADRNISNARACLRRALDRGFEGARKPLEDLDKGQVELGTP